MLKKRISISVLCLCACFLVNASLSLAQEKQTVKFISSPFGTAGYVIGTALEDISRKANGPVTVSALESQGGVYTIKKINSLSARDRLNTMVMASFVSPSLARNGIGLFRKPLNANLKALGFSWSVAIFFATTDPSIKTLSDLKGKTVVIGTRTQDNWGFCPGSWMEIGAGLKGKTRIQYAGLKAANDALLDGRADAIVVGGYLDPVIDKFVPSPKFQELLAANRDLYYIDVPDQIIKRTSAAMGNFPSMAYSLKKGSFKGLDKDLTTGFTSVAWWVDETFPEETAYELTKLIINGTRIYKDYHAIGKIITRESLVWSFDRVKNVDIHPGSKRAYQEAGMM